jgi:chromate transporter
MESAIKKTDSQLVNVSFRTAFLYWLKLGFLSFGGPAGQISMMHQDLVEDKRWISEHRFLHALNFTMTLPGPEAQQLATYIGWLMHGVWGGIVAGVLFVLPSLFILVALSWMYVSYHDVSVVAAILYGVKPAVTAVVVFAAYRIGSRVLKNPVLFLFAVASFVSIAVLKIPFPLIILGAALLGYTGSRIAPEKFIVGNVHGPQGKNYGPALIDDHTPVPEHAKFNRKHLYRYCFYGMMLWLLPMLFLLYQYGWHGTLTQMGWFFTKAALLTFGGAYAVLPYVYQGGVEHYGWLTATQMIDGLALGESTPGPLIMVVAFVGFLGGWTTEVFGPDKLTYAGIVAATLVTYFTFLPSFLFIFIGAPAIEATRHEIGFTAPLTGITAAVVGVILNLAVMFAWHVLWPEGLAGDFEWKALVIGLGALVALFYYRVGVPALIAACAVIGAGISFLP